MATPNPVVPEVVSLADLISDYHQACDGIAAWEQRRDALAANILDRLPPGAEVDGLTVMPPRRTLSAELARRRLSPLQYASICEFKPVAKKAREILSEQELEQIYETGNSRPFIRRTT